MSNACTPILVGRASPVSEILIPSKTANFPFLTMDYSPWSSKNLINRNWLKNSCRYRLISHTCTLILVGGASPVSEILLPSKTANFPLLTMDYNPWSSKNLIDQNFRKKFMQLWIDVTCMHTNFGDCTFSGFGDTATFKNTNFPFLTIDYSPWSSKNLIDRNWLKNSCKYGLMSNACTPILVGGAFLVLEILLPSKTANFPFLTMDYIHGHQKISFSVN